MSAGTLTPETALALKSTALGWERGQPVPSYAALFAWDGHDRDSALKAWTRYAGHTANAAAIRQACAKNEAGLARTEQRADEALRAFAHGPLEPPEDGPVRTITGNLRVDRAVILSERALLVLDAGIPYSDAHVLATVRACCQHVADDIELRRLWAEYVHCVQQERGIEDGILSWRDIDPELTCADKDQAAREMARERSASALDVLTGRLP